MSDVTKILVQIESGDPSAAGDLLPLIYSELRHLAARQLRDGPSGNSGLQPTALVHEAYLRLVDQTKEQRWSHRGNFYAAATEAMRRILVENARKKRPLKRGGGWERVAFDDQRVAVPQPSRSLIVTSCDRESVFST